MPRGDVRAGGDLAEIVREARSVVQVLNGIHHRYDRSVVEQVAITTAGTHVIEGMPMSWRTRDALAGLDVSAPGHRSLPYVAPTTR